MHGEFSPLKAIINPPGMQSGMPGEILELHAVVMNQGEQSAIIDVFLDEAFQQFTHSSVAPQERVALAPGQSTEVSFEIEIPFDTLPGTYDYTLVIDAPQHYPQDTPIQYPRQIKVLLKEQTIIREFDPTFTIQPTSNPGHPIVAKPNQPLQLTISVDNRSRRVDSFQLTCPDLEPEWFTIQYPQTGVEGMGVVAQGNRLELNPGNIGQIFSIFHPPVDALAGGYPLTFRLQSENSPDLVLLDVVYIQIPEVYLLDTGLNIILGRVNRSPGQYDLKLANLGNTVRNIDLSAKTKAEDEFCIYEFNPIPVKLLPAKSTIVNLTVQPNQWWRRPLFGHGLAIEFQVELTDRDQLPLTQPSLQSILVWQSRPWWQLFFLLLIILGLIGGLGLIAWKILHPPSARLVKLELRNQKIDENDPSFLSWKIDEFSRIQKILITTTGAFPEKREYSIDQLLDPNRSKDIPDCITEDRSLVCENFKTEARAPGEYGFELQLIDRSNNTIDKKVTEKLTIVPKPEPEIISFGLIPPTKLKYSYGESILVDWTIQHLQKLAGIQIIAKAEDGSMPFDRTIPENKLIQEGNCRQDRDKQQIICANFPMNITQPGKYELQVKPISKTPAKSRPEKAATTPLPQLKVEVLAKPTKILEFTVNGTTDATRVVTEGEVLIIKWKVDGDEKTTVELSPGGTVDRSGIQTLKSIKGISQISLVATDRYGKKDTRIFSIQVESIVIPSNSPTLPPNQIQLAPNPNLKSTTPIKVPKKFEDY